MAKKRFGVLAVAVVGLAAAGAVVAVRTATFKSPIVADPAAVSLAPSIPLDNAAAAKHLGEAVQFQTVTHQDPSLDQPAEWEKLHQWLAATYPAAHRVMSRDIVAGRTLIYTWPGSDPSAQPIILMAHQDVVPVAEGTEKAWRYPPFSGAVAEGAVWGRGAIDDKGSLISLFEAADALAARGFKPRRTIYFVSGQDEEFGGTGARAAAEWLKARHVKALFVIDEGSVVLGNNPLTGGKAALIGVAEKGYATLRVTARSGGGHSSTPPKEPGVVTLSRAVAAIADHPFPQRLSGPSEEMLQALAPYAPTGVRMAVANTWLFKPLLLSQFGASPAGAAMLHTTIAPTMLQGSPKENVLPTEAIARINYRIDPKDTPEAVMAQARKAVRGLKVELAWEGVPRPPSPVSSTQSESWKLVAAAAAASAHAPVAPSLVIAGTDSRSLSAVADDVYRFQPIVLSLDGTEMIHGTNEHMTLENLALMTDFYARLMATAAR